MEEIEKDHSSFASQQRTHSSTQNIFRNIQLSYQINDSIAIATQCEYRIVSRVQRTHNVFHDLFKFD